MSFVNLLRKVQSVVYMIDKKLSIPCSVFLHQIIMISYHLPQYLHVNKTPGCSYVVSPLHCDSIWILVWHIGFVWNFWLRENTSSRGSGMCFCKRHESAFAVGFIGMCADSPTL